MKHSSSDLSPQAPSIAKHQRWVPKPAHTTKHQLLAVPVQVWLPFPEELTKNASFGQLERIQQEKRGRSQAIKGGVEGGYEDAPDAQLFPPPQVLVRHSIQGLHQSLRLALLVGAFPVSRLHSLH